MLAHLADLKLRTDAVVGVLRPAELRRFSARCAVRAMGRVPRAHTRPNGEFLLNLAVAMVNESGCPEYLIRLPPLDEVISRTQEFTTLISGHGVEAFAGHAVVYAYRCRLAFSLENVAHYARLAADMCRGTLPSFKENTPSGVSDERDWQYRLVLHLAGLSEDAIAIAVSRALGDCPEYVIRDYCEERNIAPAIAEIITR